MQSTLKSPFADPTGAPTLIRRLVHEHAAANWRRYILAFWLMVVAAGITAISAALFGRLVNEAYMRKNLMDLVVVCFIIIGLSVVKGLATYGSVVQLAR